MIAHTAWGMNRATMLDLFSLVIMLSAVFMCGFMLGKDKK